MVPRPEVTVLAVAGVVAVTVLANVALFGYVWAIRGAAAAGSETRSEGDGAARCSACGTPNDADYRFCRACAADLPGDGLFEDRDARASGRSSR